MSMRFAVTLFSLFCAGPAAFAQHLVVTAEGHHGSEPPVVTQDEVTVEVNRKPASIQKWIPLHGQQAALQLYIVIDDGSDTDLALQYPSLKKFVNAQPASTEVGLAYLRNGSAEIVAPASSERAQFDKKLRIPLGEPGIASSPYMGISDLAKKWPAVDARREVLLITSGVDPWSPANPENPYLQAAIEDSQRAGILVHSIYFGGAGHFGHSYWQGNWGRNYLSELGDGTGGEAYWQGFGSPVSFEPYLKDLAERLNNQYLLTVSAPDAKKGLQQVKLHANNSKVSLMSAEKIEFK